MNTKERDGPAATKPDEATLRAINEWIAQLQDDPHPLHSSDGERLAAFHASRKRNRQCWKNARGCMFPGCVAPSVRRSHVLPRSGPLALIAQDGHLISPRLIDGESLRFQPVGIGEASTFPGFCVAHEAEFGEIEQRKDVDSHRAWTLQFFRTVCWEVRSLEHWLDIGRKNVQTYEIALLAKLNEFLATRAGNMTQVTKLKGIDWRQQTLESEIIRMEALLSSYYQDFLEPLRVDLNGGDGDLGAIVLHAQGAIIPVCLAGRGNFHVAAPSGNVTVPVFLQIFPTPTGTKLGMLTTKALAPYLSNYLAHFNKEENPPLRIAEAWMIHGTDHWFLQPSVWNELSAGARERLAEEFWDDDLSIGELTRERIFDAAHNIK